MDTHTYHYNLVGGYPDGCTFRASIACDSIMDAFALAQGVKKVTTLRWIHVLDIQDRTLAIY